MDGRLSVCGFHRKAHDKIMKFSRHITVLLADDHIIIRTGLRKLLRAESDIEVIGEAANGLKAVELALKLRPAVVIMDITMPKMNGLDATRNILNSCPDVKVLILSAHSDDAYVKMAMEAGASGYLTKQSSLHSIADVMRDVQKGGTVFRSFVAGHPVKRRNSVRPLQDLGLKCATLLTSRESEVLRMTARGLSHTDIAQGLRISAKTAKRHICSLMSKLALPDTASLIRYAIRNGIPIAVNATC